MGIAATVTFFIPRWRPAPWATTHDRSGKFGNLPYRTVIQAWLGRHTSKTTQKLPAA
jgi:hypothetical protein